MPAPEYRGTPEGLTNGLAAVLRDREEPRAPAEYESMVDSLRALLDQITGSLPPAELVTDATRHFTELTRRFEKFAVDERRQVSGRLIEVPGRGQVMAPAIAIDERTSVRASEHV